MNSDKQKAFLIFKTLWDLAVFIQESIPSVLIRFHPWQN